jgi:DNA polymerase-3 subunit epsilon
LPALAVSEDLIMAEKKECEQCHAEKELDLFRKVTNQYTGVHPMSICKDCHKSNNEERTRRQAEEWEARKAAQEAERRAQEEAQEQRRQQQEAERVLREEEWQRHEEEWKRQREERQQWLVNWFDQQPDRANYVHPSLMQLPQEEGQYPYLKIDAIVKYYHRWTSTYAVRKWLCYLESLEYCVVDTETTGSRRFSQVIEIAILNKQGSVIYTTFLQPTTSIEPLATSIHGLTWQDVKDAPQFSQVYQDIYAHLAGKLVLAYNASFDIHSLFRTARAFQVPFPRLQVGCLLYAYSKLKGERYEESDQYRRFVLAKACINEGITFPGIRQIGDNYYQTDFHRAEQDARYLYELLQRMIEAAHLTTS